MEAETTDSTEIYLKVVEWLQTNRKALVICGGVGMVIALIIAVMSWQKASAESEANKQLMSLPLITVNNGKLVPTPPGPFLDLAKSSPDTSAGEYAALLAAGTLFTDGKYPESHQEFAKFVEQYPNSTLLPQARIGLAASLDAQGKTQEAAQKYQEVISSYPSDANITSPAKLTLARLDEQLGKFEQAITFYSELARNQNPYDPWAGEARERGDMLLATHPELRKQQATGPVGLPGQPQPPGQPIFPSSQTQKKPAPASTPAPTSPTKP
jgi:predicted negative regulator of RcsB-dependent stress response